jgi:hypothetical protein
MLRATSLHRAAIVVLIGIGAALAAGCGGSGGGGGGGPAPALGGGGGSGSGSGSAGGGGGSGGGSLGTGGTAGGPGGGGTFPGGGPDRFLFYNDGLGSGLQAFNLALGVPSALPGLRNPSETVTLGEASLDGRFLRVDVSTPSRTYPYNAAPAISTTARRASGRRSRAASTAASARTPTGGTSSRPATRRTARR